MKIHDDPGIELDGSAAVSAMEQAMKKEHEVVQDTWQAQAERCVADYQRLHAVNADLLAALKALCDRCDEMVRSDYSFAEWNIENDPAVRTAREAVVNGEV